VTGLAKVRGITKGAASQMVYKLVDKGLVEKRVSPSSDSELNLYLTKLGKKARAEHRKKHETLGEKFSEIMDGISEEMQDDMLKVLKSFEEELDKLQ
jgi:DNA-binding MarR family transcriptional regulator